MSLLDCLLFVKMHFQGQAVDKEPIKTEYILLEVINTGEELAKILLIT